LGVDLVVSGVLVVGEVEVEGGFLEVLGEIDLLPEFLGSYLYSLMMTCPWVPIFTISLSFFCSYFLLRGLLRMATVILGV
jgi:hypothetical protein